MNCNCLTEKPKQILKGLNKQEEYNGSIEDVRFKDEKLTINKDGELTARLSTPIELVIKGRKTPKKVPLFFNFCPFCGSDLSQKKE